MWINIFAERFFNVIFPFQKTGHNGFFEEVMSGGRGWFIAEIF